MTAKTKKKSEKSGIGKKAVLWGLVVVAGGLAFGIVLPVSAQLLDGEEQAFLAQINAYREGSPLCWDGRAGAGAGGWVPWPAGSSPTLSLSAALTRAAEAHTQVMVTQNCFDHVCAGEPDLPGRVAQAGYPSSWRFLAENLVAGAETAREAFRMWRESEGHNRNMLACRARAIGIARAFGPGTRYGWYWTTVFGDVVDASPAPSPSRSPLREFDINGNDLLDDPEFFATIDAWVQGDLSDYWFFLAIDLWVTRSPISSASSG